MKKIIVPFVIFLMSFLVLMPKIALASDPVGMLNSIANQMISELKSHQASLKTNPTVVYAIANRVVVPHANLDAMAQHVLPPQTWRTASAAQRSEFKRQFTMVLERTYASALANYSDETVRFFPVRGGVQGSMVTVQSEIDRSSGSPIRVSYRLIGNGGNWQLFDMSVEGVSMLDSFRSQFADQLSRGNIDNLIKVLHTRNGA